VWWVKPREVISPSEYQITIQCRLRHTLANGLCCGLPVCVCVCLCVCVCVCVCTSGCDGDYGDDVSIWGAIIWARLDSHCTNASTNIAIGRTGSTWRTAATHLRQTTVELAVLAANWTRQDMCCDNLHSNLHSQSNSQFTFRSTFTIYIHNLHSRPTFTIYIQDLIHNLHSQPTFTTYIHNLHSRSNSQSTFKSTFTI